METLGISREKDRQTDRQTHTHKATTQQEVCSWEREVQQAHSRAAAGGRKDQRSVGNPRRLHGGSEISPGGLQALVQIHCKTKEHTLKVWGGMGIHRAPCGQRTTGEEWQQMSPGLACEGPLTGSHPENLAFIHQTRGTTDRSYLVAACSSPTIMWKQARNGVHQDCILQPCLINSYAECIMQNARLDEAHAGIKQCWEKYQ